MTKRATGDLNAPATVGIRPVLVTGGAGFIGCNLADRLADEGSHVLVLDALSRTGVQDNVAWLKERHPQKISFVQDDVSSSEAARAVQGASAVFHLAAQVAVTTSLDDPQRDFATNAAGTLSLLEAARRSNTTIPLIFASTNKVYGELKDLALELSRDSWLPVDGAVRRSGIGEDRPLDFHTPYGCSKGTADQYVIDYARSFGVPTAVMRMSCIYGPQQMGTEDQGWVAHFLIRAIVGETISIFGDGRQVRDILYVSDAVQAYIAALRNIEAIKGKAFNLGGGPANAVSLSQLLRYIESLIGRPVARRFFASRAGDQRYYVSDTGRVRAALGLATPIAWRDGVARLYEWLENKDRTARARPAAAPWAEVRP